MFIKINMNYSHIKKITKKQTANTVWVVSVKLAKLLAEISSTGYIWTIYLVQKK